MPVLRRNPVPPSPARRRRAGSPVQRFIARLARSRFFMVSLALHFVLVITGGTAVLVKNAVQSTDVMDAEGGNLVATDAAVPPPDPVLQPLDQAVQPAVNPATSLPTAPSLDPIISNSAVTASFELPQAALTVPTSAPTTIISASGPTGPAAPPMIGKIPANLARQMVAFSAGTGAPNSERGSGISKSRTFQFTAYVAKYSGGDWASTVRVQNGKVTMGSLSNLLYLLNKWSRDKIKADPDPVPLELASDELFTKRPPFIFFTGHQDFKLTEQEVANLQKYVQLGGAIWGDSSLPGRRSRFDIAFRREMKRVLPDIDKAFEPLPPGHAIFTKTYFPEIREVPPGLNYFREPVEALKIYDEIAVLYTANDYADMWQIGMDEQGRYDERKDEQDQFVAINNAFWNNRDIYFRNLETKPLADSYKFGANVVLHLLTRWEEKLRNVPTGL